MRRIDYVRAVFFGLYLSGALAGLLAMVTRAVMLVLGLGLMLKIAAP